MRCCYGNWSYGVSGLAQTYWIPTTAPHTHTPTHTHIRTQTHTRTHKHTHTHTHTENRSVGHISFPPLTQEVIMMHFLLCEEITLWGFLWVEGHSSASSPYLRVSLKIHLFLSSSLPRPSSFLLPSPPLSLYLSLPLPSLSSG